MSDLKTDVVVVGGGLAGLTSAVGLSREGVDVIVLEADKRLGGRAMSWTDPVTGDPVHIGPHIFLTEYPNMFALLDILGTRDKVVWQSDRFITLADGARKIVMKGSRLPAPFQFVPAMFSAEDMKNADVASNLAVTLYAIQIDEEDVLRLDDMNAWAFLRRMGVTKRFINQFWSFASMAIMNVPIELCSAGAIMRFYKRILGKREYYFGFPDGGLGDVFCPGASREIDRNGGRIMLETAMRNFIVERGRVVGVELRDGRKIRAEKVIAALPPTVLRELIPGTWMEEHQVFEDLVHFHPSPYVSSFLWFDQKLTDLKMWARIHRPKDLNCDFYDLSNIHTGWEERPSVITSNIIYSDRVAHMTDDEIVAQTVREIAEFLPAARTAEVTHAVVNRIPMAIHCPFPGTEQRRPATRAPIPGLLLAGDWIRTSLPSSMESAAMSGWLAAEAVLADFGRPRQFAIDHEIEGLTKVVNDMARYFPPKRMMRWARRVRDRLEEVV